MKSWTSLLKYNPIKPLLDSNNQAIVYYAKRDLLEEQTPSILTIWNLETSRKLLRKQESSGFWRSKSANRQKAPAVNYDLFETFKYFSQLIEMYEFNSTHESIRKATEYIFSCQTEEGDIRGIIGEQYAPYYTGLIMSLLIKAGYANDARIKKGFEWLLQVRQDDGGWIIGSPGCFGQYSKDELTKLTTHFVGTKKDFDYSQPFTHSGTGMIIRAFAYHPEYRKSDSALKAASLLKQQFFRKDNSSSYQDPNHWVNFKYPFFWTDLISALDSLSLIGVSRDDVYIKKALKWLVDNQLETGLWNNSYSKIHSNNKNEKTYQIQLWISLVICRIFKRFYKD